MSNALPFRTFSVTVRDSDSERVAAIQITAQTPSAAADHAGWSAREKHGWRNSAVLSVDEVQR